VDPGFQNSGRGLKILKASLVSLRASVKGPFSVRAEIFQDNGASRSLFRNAGFFLADDSISGRIIMKMEL
jgi:hypothetical protein